MGRAVVHQPVATVSPDSPQWRAGDLVFRRGTSIKSAAVESVDHSGYTHVGILAGASPLWTIIHVEPKDNEGGGQVEEIPLAMFVKPAKASRYAIFRATDSSVAATEAVRNAKMQVGRPFDADYRYSTEDLLYCTELVGKAFAKAGIILIKPAEGARVPLMNEPVVLPAALVAISRQITSN